MLGRDGRMGLRIVKIEPIMIPDGKRGVVVWIQNAKPAWCVREQACLFVS